MTAQEYYEIIEGCNGWWKEEPTNEAMNGEGNVFLWMFHQPTRSVPEGTFILDYRINGKKKTQTGKFLVAVEQNHPATIHIDREHFYEIYIQNNGREMIWKSNNSIKRIFHLQEVLTGSDNIFS